MSQEQLHKPAEAVGDISTDYEEQPKSLVPSQDEQQEDPSLEAAPVSTEQQLKPNEDHALTYGEVFPAVAAQPGSLAGEAITTEDASLMQKAESMAFGHTLKDGAASAMQSAAAKNVLSGFVEKDAHSPVSEYGLSVTETSVPGAVMDIEYVAGHPVTAAARPTPTDPAIAALDAVTIGEALEAAALGAGNRPIEDSDARAIESAERRATGVAMPVKGGIGATAQAAAQLNLRADTTGQTTLADVLMDATSDLPADKVVTYEDAYKVLEAELRGRNIEDLRAGGVGASLVVAADLNAQSGLVPPPPGSLAGKFDLQPEVNEDDAELHKYQRIESANLSESHGEGLGSDSLDRDFAQTLDTEVKATPVVGSNTDRHISHGEGLSSESFDRDLTQILGTEEETAPLVSSDVDVPSHASEKLPASGQITT